MDTRKTDIWIAPCGKKRVIRALAGLIAQPAIPRRSRSRFKANVIAALAERGDGQG